MSSSVARCHIDDEELMEVPDQLQDLVDGMRCPICLSLATVWKTLPCKHDLCEICVGRLIYSNDLQCPFCKEPYSTAGVTVNVDKASQATKLPVLCPLPGRSNGCTWHGNLGDAQGHVAECGYHPADCHHEGCEARPLRKDLDAHKEECGFKIVKCRHETCPAEFQQRHIDEKSAHEDVCGKMVVDCPLCQDPMLSEVLQTHLDHTCPETTVKCSDECVNTMGEHGKRLASDNSVLLCLAQTCAWEGTRRALREHRQSCVPQGTCSAIFQLLEDIQKLKANVMNKSEENSTYVWDIRFIVPRQYKRGDCVKSPDLYLRGRKWQVTLKPMGDLRESSNDFAVYLDLLDLQEGERLDVQYVLKYGVCTETISGTYETGHPAWGSSKLAPIPNHDDETFSAPIEIRVKMLHMSEK